MEESVVLEEDIDPNYVPTEEEFKEYAESLGLELPEDSDLLYLAREGLKARLPKEWKPCQTRDGQIFYFNFETGESVWDHPCDSIYRKKVKEARDAKKLGKDKKPKALSHSKKTNNPLSFSPVLEQPENPEFLKRKKEIEEEFQAFNEQSKKEYAEKKNEQKRIIDKELEDMKEKWRKMVADKEESGLKVNKQKLEQTKIAIRKQLEKEENEEISKIQKEFLEKIKEVKEGVNKKLLEEKEKSVKRSQQEAEEMLKRLKRSQELELEELKNELVYSKQRTDMEVQEKASVVQRQSSRLQDLKDRLGKEFEEDKLLIEKETEKQLKSIKQEANGELSNEDRSFLYNLEKELTSNLKKETFAMRSENSEKLEKERERIAEEARTKNENARIEFELQIKEVLMSKESELKLELNESINQYIAKKDSELDQDLKDYEERLKRALDSEEQQSTLRKKNFSIREDERKAELEAQIRLLQREIANSEHVLYMKASSLTQLKDDEARLRTEIQRTEIEGEDLKGQDYLIENVVIADLEKQLLEKESEIAHLGENEPKRIKILESEVSSLKRTLHRQKNESIDHEQEKLRITIASEKEELKALQSMLKQDREKWNREMKEYKLRPSEKKRIELYNIKRIIEKNIQRHNLRVKELKQAEEGLKCYEGDASEDEELLLEMWRNAETRPNQQAQYTRQPWQNHNIHVYQRQVNKWCKNREYMKDVMTRHGSWLNNMKEQLNRVMSTPHTIKTFY